MKTLLPANSAAQRRKGRSTRHEPDAHVPNAETVRAIQEAESGRGLHRFDSVKGFMAHLHRHAHAK